MENGVKEVRIHGRGGQGAKTAGQFIAEAAMYEGKEMQAFPEYGPERRGAPVVSYVKISKEKIKAHTPIHHAEVVMVLDQTLLGPEISYGADKTSIMIVNTTKSIPEVKKLTGFKGRVIPIDATKIALDTIGLDVPNTPMLGAFVKTTGIVSLNKIKESVECNFLEKLGREKTTANIRAVEKAYEVI